MKHFFRLIVVTVILMNGDYAVAYSTKTTSTKDVEIQFVILEFPKYEKFKIQLMLSELHSYSGKIYDAQFDYSTQRISIHYYSTIGLDDIFQVVGSYQMDFNKIDGSEL